MRFNILNGLKKCLLLFSVLLLLFCSLSLQSYYSHFTISQNENEKVWQQHNTTQLLYRRRQTHNTTRLILTPQVSQKCDTQHIGAYELNTYKNFLTAPAWHKERVIGIRSHAVTFHKVCTVFSAHLRRW